MIEVNLETLSISELKEMLLNLSLLKKLGIEKSKIEEILLEKKISNLAKKLFGEDFTLVPSSSASPSEYDISHRPTTQNAANFDREMAAIGDIKETLKGVIAALENGENLLED